MKNILSYFYQIIINDNDINNEGYFFYNNNYFKLETYLRNNIEIKEILLLNNYLINKNILINRIILNNYNEPLTYYNNIYYVLLKIDYKEVNNKDFFFLEAPNLNLIKRNNWGELWSRKIDYVEYQIEHLRIKYPLLYNSVNYYIGLSENAIMYFKMLDLKNEKLYINHHRIRDDIDYYNPLSLIIDYKVRDISEYIKYQFINKKMTILEIKEYVNKINLNNMDYILLYVRMLFPSFYFDYYDLIINGKMEEKEIENITNDSIEYEYLLKELYNIFKNKVNLIKINWL